MRFSNCGAAAGTCPFSYWGKLAYGHSTRKCMRRPIDQLVGLIWREMTLAIHRLKRTRCRFEELDTIFVSLNLAVVKALGHKLRNDRMHPMLRGQSGRNWTSRLTCCLTTKFFFDDGFEKRKYPKSL